VSIGGSIKVISAGAAWRTFGYTQAGEVLLNALSSDDEQQRMLAGMSLVKAGERSIELIANAAASGRASPAAVRLLADLSGPRCRALLTKIAAEPGDLGMAANQSLKLLDRIDACGNEEG
jgi:hypothetical protein